MNRRDFLRNCAIIAAGAIAADQLELLERLAPRRLYWPGADFTRRDAFEVFYTSYWRLECTPRNNALVSRIDATVVDRQRFMEFQSDAGLVAGRRLIRPILTAEGFDELTYERVRV